MGVKLSGGTTIEIDQDDLCAILTDALCSSSYGAFSNLHVFQIDALPNGDFRAVLERAPKAPEN